MSQIDASSRISSRPYTLQASEPGVAAPTVVERSNREAEQIDTNGDGVCADAEIEAFLRARHEIKARGNADVPKIIEEFKTHLQGRVKSFEDEGYRSLEQMEREMRELAEARPDLVQLQSIAKTSEGRDVWALKVTSDAQGDTSNKPGVVINGTHHAREWMTPEVTLQLAEDLVSSYDTNPESKRRLDNAELWIIPVVNPDGFQYSRTDDNWWRKNRTPVTGALTECPNDDSSTEVLAYGVDLNRNYWDGDPAHIGYFRAEGDSPCSSWDDNGASDDPNDDTFRGLPGKEPEVAALMALEYGRPNMRGVLDHHSYGESLLRPWGHTEEIPANVADYDEVAARMNAAQGDTPYDYHQSVLDYPTYGSSETAHQGQGLLNFTVEMGRSFQPDYEDFPEIYRAVSSADLAFVDYIIEKNPPTAPAPPAPPAPEPPPSQPAV